MNLFFDQQAQTYNLLSIGQRGVGKTVFLAGSYVELHPAGEIERSQNLWFTCQDQQVQENVESILNYVCLHNQYPSPTMKITRFNFSLQRQVWWGTQTLCHFRWNDIPGEICDIHNLEFRQMVYNSHGCCVFIDAYALRYSSTYLQIIEDIIEQVTVIASLVYLNGLEYPFAIILTKSDLLETDSLNRHQLENRLKPLTKHLDTVKANYQTFYSSIPIVQIKGGSILRAKGASVAILWLVWELSKARHPNVKSSLLNLINRLLPKTAQSQQEFSFGTLQALFNSNGKAVTAKPRLNFNWISSNRKSVVLVSLAIAGLIGISGKLLIDYQRFFQGTSNDVNVLSTINNLQQAGRFNQAIPLVEKLIQQQPERLELRLQLAELYEFTGEITKAEAVYDQILAKQNNHVKALVNKAVLRQVQGDSKNAAALFKQAEKVAPFELKEQVRSIAKNTLQSPAKSLLNNN